jgi:hypothetical protein
MHSDELRGESNVLKFKPICYDAELRGKVGHGRVKKGSRGLAGSRSLADSEKCEAIGCDWRQATGS